MIGSLPTFFLNPLTFLSCGLVKLSIPRYFSMVGWVVACIRICTSSRTSVRLLTCRYRPCFAGQCDGSECHPGIQTLSL
jgi:hypothetical protein